MKSHLLTELQGGVLPLVPLHFVEVCLQHCLHLLSTTHSVPDLVVLVALPASAKVQALLEQGLVSGRQPKICSVDYFFMIAFNEYL